MPGIPSKTVSHRRAVVARAKKSYPDDHPKVVKAVRDLDDAMRVERVEKIVVDFPKLSDEQKARVVALLNAGGGDLDETT